MKHTRVSTATIVPAGRLASTSASAAEHRIRCAACTLNRIHEVLAEAIVGRHLLTHPFYRRWEAGTLAEGELAAYAEQYRHIERELPVTLAAIAAALAAGPRPRRSSRRTWPTSCGTPAPHTELFESFAAAAGAAADVRADAVDGGAAGRSCARRRRPIRWPRWPWWPPTRCRRPTSRRRRPTGCAGTTASTRTAPASGTSTAPRRSSTPGGRWRPWRELGADPDVVQAAADRVGRLVVAVPQRARRAGAGRRPADARSARACRSGPARRRRRRPPAPR